MPQHQMFNFKTKLYLGYASIISLLVILAVMVYNNLSRLEQERAWVEHTYQAIEFAQKCGALMVDMETGVRGFLVSGQEKFLEPYQKGLNEFESSWTAGRKFTSDNPSQTRRWDDLKSKQETWLKTVAQPEIDMRREVKLGEKALKEFEKISARPGGKEILDKLRDHLADLDSKFVHMDDHDGADLIMSLFMSLLNQETGQRGFLLTGLEESLEPFIKGKADFDTNYATLAKIDLTGKGVRTDEIFQIKSLADQWHEVAAAPEIKARREINKHPLRLKDVAALLEAGTGKQLTDEIRDIISDMVAEEKDLLIERAHKTESLSKRTVVVVVFGTLFATFIALLISFFIVKVTSRQLGTDPKTLEQVAKKLAGGDVSIELDLDKQELSGVYASTIEMVNNMKAIVKQAEAVARGDYSQKIEIRSSKDQLGAALSQMTKELGSTSAKNKAVDYLRAGQTSLNEKLRGEKNLSTITDTTIRFISEYLEAQVGAFYLLTDKGVLELSATYAYKRRKNISDSFKVGEGIVGQAAREKKPILISEIPEDYIHITSGLGNTVPGALLVYPVKLNNKIKGVIELASIQIFSDQHIEFLDSISQSIAITLQSAESRDEMKRLLEKTQEQAEDLQSQQEELREANEILETQKQSLIESETRLQDQQEELRQTNEELEEQTQLLEEQKTSIQNKNVELETTRKLIEEKAKDLELTSKYKSEFLANMSHELRTPLNSILLLSKLLADNKENSLTPKQQEYSNTIHLSGTELLNLINEILDLSKVESGKMEINLEQLSLKEMARRFERTFKPQAENKGLNLFIDLAEGLPERIRTDGQRLEQIIKNLISNSLKFTSTGSINLKIERPPENLNLSEFGLESEKAIAFSVSDTGEGIAQNKQKLIFEAFQQADGTTSRKYGGSGLGLSISRELVKLLGGGITLQSIPKKGSTFTVYLPESMEKQFTSDSEKTHRPTESRELSEKTIEPESKPLDPPSTTTVFIPDDRNSLKPGDKTILIIEDDSRFAKTLSDLAREREYKVLVAGDGETGLHFADYYTPNAIILDIGLPGMDGWSVMDRLKEHPKTRHIPVHFISAHDKSVEARKMGAIGFITKPVTISLLDEAFEKIDHLIAGEIRKLLVVEDDDIQRKAMVELIGNGDVHTIEAASGEEALDLIKVQQFDCIILDLGLPDVTGVDFLTRMKEDDTITEVPIIVYTGKELTVDEEAIINEYAEKIIIKGVKSAEKLLDETTLFLHRVEADLPEEKRKMIRVLHDRESVFHEKKILVVDDDMRNVYAITNVLEEKGLNVVGAPNGQKGVDMLEENPDIDLVLMDIMMPEMNGYEAIEIIRKNKAFKKLPIIALTAKAMKGDRKKCIEAGANDYLAKPVNTDKLLSMMRVWLY